MLLIAASGTPGRQRGGRPTQPARRAVERSSYGCRLHALDRRARVGRARSYEKRLWAGRERGRPARSACVRVARRGGRGVPERQHGGERCEQTNSAEDYSAARFHAAHPVARQVAVTRCAVFMVPLSVWCREGIRSGRGAIAPSAPGPCPCVPQVVGRRRDCATCGAGSRSASRAHRLRSGNPWPSSARLPPALRCRSSRARGRRGAARSSFPARADRDAVR